MSEAWFVAERGAQYTTTRDNPQLTGSGSE
jgi:hypothetical protein